MESASAPSRPPLATALIRAAEEEIAENGIGALSMRAIARRVGVSHQAPGHHFRDRSGLLTALVVEGFEALAVALREGQEQLRKKTSPTDRVAAAGVSYIRFAGERPALFSVMMRPELHRADDPELVRARAAAYGVLLQVIEEVHAEGWGAGRSVDELAMACWASVHGIVTLWRDGDLAVIYPGMSIDQIAGTVLGMLAEALAAA